jgi:ATP-dependent exoDNAse (exonuclease V) beta subunit
LRSKDELLDELDPSAFGSIFHHAAENLYREIGRQATAPYTVQAEDFQAYLEHPHLLRRLVLKAFEVEYFKGRPVAEDDFNGEQLLNFRVITKMLEWLVRFDRRRAPFTIIGLEHPVSGVFTLDDAGIRLSIGGIIDRLEEKDGQYHILDYKTGGKAKECRSLEDLFEAKPDRPAHILQTFIYASALMQSAGTGRPIVPELLYIQQAFKEDYSAQIRYAKQPLDDFRPLYPDFIAQLARPLSEIFDPGVPFEQTAIAAACEYCDFREICGR